MRASSNFKASAVFLGLCMALAGPAARADLMLYEPFDYPIGETLAGRQVGHYTGMIGEWTAGVTDGDGSVYTLDATSGQVWDGRLAGSTLPITGGFIGGDESKGVYDHFWGERPMASTVTNSFLPGTTTWMSAVFAVMSNRAHRKPMLAIGAGALAGGPQRAETAGGQAIGGGSKYSDGNGMIRASYWDDETGSFPGVFERHNTGSGLRKKIPQEIFVAKIEWDVEVNDPWNPGTLIEIDRVTVYNFAIGDQLTEAAFDQAASQTIDTRANLDQSTFDTLSFAGSRYFIDEIRIGTTFSDVVAGTTVVAPTVLTWDGTDAAEWTTAHWLPGSVAPAGREAMVIDSGRARVSSDLATALGPATSLDIAGGALGGTVDIGPAGSLAVAEHVSVGAGGTLNVVGSLTASTLNVGGGVVNASAPITITHELTIGDEPSISVTGGSFGISGTDLQNGAARMLTLEGGTVRIADRGVAPGGAVSVNFVNRDEGAMAPVHAAGILPTVNWNNTNGSPIGSSSGSLVDNVGATVGAMTIDWLADDTGSTWNSTGNGDQKMMTGYLADFGAGISVIVDNIPFDTYDVLAYLGSLDDAAKGSTQISQRPSGAAIDMAEFQFIALSKEYPFPGAYVQMTATSGEGIASNWALWTGLTESSFELFTVATEGILGVHGLQIIDRAARARLNMGATSITVAADTTLDIGGADSVTFADLALGAGNTLTVAARLPAAMTLTSISGTGTLGGDISGVTVSNVDPGHSAGAVTVNSDVTLADGASFDAEVIIAAADSLVAAGTVTLGADTSLNVIPVGGGGEFQAGAYVLIDADALSGTFANVTDLSGYVTGDGLTYNAAGGTVTLTFELNLNPGDANLDGATDVLDRIIWNNHNFTEGTAFVTGDWNNDGATDVLDRIVWNNNNFTLATAGPGPIAAHAPDADASGPEFVYDAETGVMRVRANGHFITDIVVPGPDGVSLLPGLVLNFRTPPGAVLWDSRNFRGKFQAWDGASNGADGEFDLARFPLGLTAADFGEVEWGGVPIPGEPGESGVTDVIIIPEPATIGLLALGALAMLRRRWR